ncbi:cytochrome c [Roseovarius halotolerans]|uniref:Cytochrome c-551 n=1 Tax=Roseovarius halotolerans TaxID=505353 RepID=A0A1X6YDA3_9RHOB|nr:cytochrome C [Roseovarius halotolerans]RKT34858.1 cytochrome c [Roseovarius halotolerans]SLN17562.1 Cytochrome c-551 precursor [Roseovarius halotolerans]
MKSMFTASAVLLALAAPALAAGDADKGEKEFRKCKACHMIQADDGEMIVKGGRTGPNLYGVIGRTAGSVEDFKYGDSIVAAGEAGLVWSEENIVPYVEDPKAFLAEQTGDSGARSKMTFKLPKGGEDVAAYLATFSAQ